MVTKCFRFYNKTKYCDVYISVVKKKGKRKYRYFINLNFIYSDKSIDSTMANPLSVDGINRGYLNVEMYSIKCNNFNYGLVDYLLMDMEKLRKYSGYKTAYEYKRELLKFLDIKKYCFN